MPIIYKYQIYCETEAVWKYTWGTIPPTTCPTNTSHTIIPSSVSIIGQSGSNTVTVEQYTQGGLFGTVAVPINIPIGTPGTITEHYVPFDDTIMLWDAAFNGHTGLIGDQFSVIINPDTPIGGLTVAAETGSNILNVSTTVTGNITTGMYITLLYDDSPPVVQNLGKVLNVDKDAGTITVKDYPNFEFPPGTVVLLNLYLAKDIPIDMLKRYHFGNKGFNGKIIPAGTTFKMIYTNNDGLAKTLNWQMDFYYGLDST